MGHLEERPEYDGRHDVAVDFTDVPRKRYFFGTEGSALRKHVAIAGSIGFLLFGYDQGVLGVSQQQFLIKVAKYPDTLTGVECCSRILDPVQSSIICFARDYQCHL